MTRKLLLLFLLSVGLSVWAQDNALLRKMNPIGLSLLQKYERAIQSRANGEQPNIEVPDEILVLVTVNDGVSESELEKIPGVTILNPGKKVLLVKMPLNQVENVAQCPATKSMSFGEQAKPLLDKARPASNVTGLQQGLKNGLPKNYSGKGILLGMMDEGLDPNHINFLNSSLSENRIKQLWWMPSNNPSQSKSYSTPSAIAGFTTDNSSATHGTHVAGIMGGSYNGTSTVATYENNRYALLEEKNPFYGVAPDAEMALNCGALYNSNIELALLNFIDYCNSEGKPGVFNLSLGTNFGPHDGSSSFCRFISQYTDDMVIVIASGNEGDYPLSIQKTFSSTSDNLQTMLFNGHQTYYSGLVDMWSANSETFDVTFGIFNLSTKSLIYSCPFQSSDPASMVYGTGTMKPGFGIKGYPSSEFLRYFSNDSYVTVYNSVNEDNNRFNSLIDLELTLKNPLQENTIIPVFIFTGKAGVSLDGYAQGSGSELYFTNEGLEGWVNGNSKGSINDLATAKGVLVAGSYITKTSWPIVGGYIFSYSANDQIDQVSGFTSYGTLVDGRTLPDFCAPGQGIVSSYSTYYVNENVENGTQFYDDGTTKISYPDGSIANIDRSSLVNGANADRTDYWYLSQGTSMSTPYISGVAALLLEQSPTLKASEIKSILASTASIRAGQTLTEDQKIQWGAGKIDAVKAMQKLINDPSAIGDVKVDTNDKLWIDQTDTELTASLAGERGVTAHLYSMAGYDVASAQGGESVTINISRLPKGVYILTLQSADGAKISRRVLIGQR